MNRLACCLFLLLASTPLLAKGGYDTEFAKLNTSDAGVVDVGAMEFGVSYGFLEGRRCFDEGGRSLDQGCLTERGFSLGLTAGLWTDFDLTAGMGYSHTHDSDAIPAIGKGFTDLELTGRWRPAQDDRWAFAILPSIILPIGTGADEDDFHTGSSQGFTSLGLSLLYQRAFGRIPLNLEAGYGIGMGEIAEGYNGTLALNASLGWHATPSFLPILEANYSRNFFEEETSEALAFTVGVLFPTEHSGRFQLGISPIVWGRSTDAGTGINLSWIYGFSIKGDQ